MIVINDIPLEVRCARCGLPVPRVHVDYLEDRYQFTAYCHGSVDRSHLLYTDMVGVIQIIEAIAFKSEATPFCPNSFAHGRF